MVELLHGLSKPHSPEVAACRREATQGAGQCCWERRWHILLQQQEQLGSFLSSVEGKDGERGNFELPEK